ncbi:hypothetical protein SAMN04487783_0643 [Agrococcus baldri]|uniref:Uncharacterized protein n=1 Tax=Agrococcus baldri TaxID=153730 RepID=A0AA94KYU0_9MICO|nr:hypothetical protein [Agrococcus baldri]SFS02331.1 hypothetical protein SAMN04487783_0643 [Agrococcus baldri]
MTLPLFDAHDDAEHRHFHDPAFARIRRGWYVDRAALEALPQHQRHLLDVRAVAAARPRAIFARESALVLAGLPAGIPQDVFTIGRTATSGYANGVRHSHAAIDDADVVETDGIAHCSPAYALADIARRGRQVDAVSALDWALRTGAVGREAVTDALARQGRRGQRRAAWVVAFADPLAESVGESWSRVAFHRMGAPSPQLQVRVMTRLGPRFPDFLWERPGMRPLGGEFDGAVKYGVLAAANGVQPVDAVIREKQREDALREHIDTLHWMWDSVQHPERLMRMLAGARVPVRGALLPGW